MKRVTGPRPWSIWASCALILLQGLWHLGAELVELYQWVSLLETVSQDVRAQIDWRIVTACARFTIVCIPVIAILFFASRVAMWLITITASYLVFSIAYSVLSITVILGILPNPGDNWGVFITPVSLGLASILLFTQRSAFWFEKKKSSYATAFE